MFKYFALCCFALLAVAASKPSIVSPLATYSTSLLTAPITTGYTLPYASYASYSPYSPYSPYSTYSPYYSAYSTYPYGSILVR